MMLFCCLHSRLPDPDGVIRIHPSNDSLYPAGHPVLKDYIARLPTNTKKPQPRSIPNHYYDLVGDFDPALQQMEDVFWTRHYSHHFKVKVGLLQRLLTVRTEWSRK